MIKNVSTFLYLLIFYIFAKYASIYMDMPSLNTKYILWAENAHFYITTKDAFVLVGLFLLFLEIYKAAIEGEKNYHETIISFITAVAYLAFFLIWKRVHTIDFFMLTVMAFIDAIGGFIISIKAAQKDINVN